MSNLLKSQKTHFTPNEKVKKEWYLVDASGQTLGRLASRLAYRLRGKHRTDYAPHQNMGDTLVVINASKIFISGNKNYQKIYYQHTGYTGNLKETSFAEMLAKNPEKIIQLAVKRMLPKNALGRALLNNLRIYAGTEHLHQAQKLKKWELTFN